MKHIKVIRLVLLLQLLLPVSAFAYLGPGLGAGTIGVILGFIASIFLGIFAVVYYPIKRFLKNKRNQTETVMNEQSIEGFDHSTDGDEK